MTGHSAGWIRTTDLTITDEEAERERCGGRPPAVLDPEFFGG